MGSLNSNARRPRLSSVSTSCFAGSAWRPAALPAALVASVRAVEVELAKLPDGEREEALGRISQSLFGPPPCAKRCVAPQLYGKI